MDNFDVSPQLKNYISTSKSQFNDLDDNPCDVSCLLCDSTFTFPKCEKDFLLHLFKEHRLVISDVEKIASLKSYIRYWRMKFKEQPLTTYCTSFVMKKEDAEVEESKSNQDEYYFLLSDCLMEDKTLRYEIQQAKLEWILAQQVKERSDTSFRRGCLFCRTEFSGSRVEYIKHLYHKHNILLGKPENLVFIDEYLDKIQQNIENFVCLYCEKKFKNRLVLKEHMRKKLHKQVNPKNKEYDKYYVSNYLADSTGHGKQTDAKILSEEIENEVEDPSGFSSDNEDDDWSDWNNENINVECLFCSHKSPIFSQLLDHIKIKHKFDFKTISKELTFYQKVKIVNYIRKKVLDNKCIYCDGHVENMILHMETENHFKLPAKEIWDQPEFYFPMFESDSFLYNLDTNSDSD